jgi:class 3 adenylate cyclase
VPRRGSAFRRTEARRASARSRLAESSSIALIASHRGRIFNTAGDSIADDFASAVDAVQCAVAVQEAITKENSDRPADERMRFRIGIHVGDIMVQGETSSAMPSISLPV